MATTIKPELYAIRKDGKTVKSVVGTIRSDGVLSIGKGEPLVLSSECKRLGVSIDSVSLVAGPIECLGKLGSNPGDIEVMLSSDAARLDIAADEVALDKAVPGVVEILKLAETVKLAAMGHEDARRREIERGTIMTDARKPSPADAERLVSLLAANPRAALYLDAERQFQSAATYDHDGRGKAAQETMRMLKLGFSLERCREELTDYGDDD